jgi:hypothetical protein
VRAERWKIVGGSRAPGELGVNAWACADRCSAGVCRGLSAVAWTAGGAQLWQNHASRGRLWHLIAELCLVGLVQLILIVLPWE